MYNKSLKNKSKFKVTTIHEYKIKNMNRAFKVLKLCNKSLKYNIHFKTIIKHENALRMRTCHSKHLNWITNHLKIKFNSKKQLNMKIKLRK